MKKHHGKELQDPIEPIHPAEGQNGCPNYCPFDFHKTIELMQDPLEEEVSQEEEASPEEEVSPEEEASPEEEVSLEEEDTWEEEEYHLEDLLEAVGDHHHYQCHKPIKGN